MRQRCSKATARWWTARTVEPEDEHAVVGEQRQVGVAHGAAGVAGGGRRLLTAAAVLVDQTVARRRRGPSSGRRRAGSGPCSAQTVPQRGWLCMATSTSSRSLCSSRCSGMPERHRPVALEHVAVEVDADDVLGPQLVPRQEPRVAEQRAVALVDRDVAGEVVVVALAPQRAGQQHQLLALASGRGAASRRWVGTRRPPGSGWRGAGGRSGRDRPAGRRGRRRGGRRGRRRSRPRRRP